MIGCKTFAPTGILTLDLRLAHLACWPSHHMDYWIPNTIYIIWWHSWRELLIWTYTMLVVAFILLCRAYWKLVKTNFILSSSLDCFNFSSQVRSLDLELILLDLKPIYYLNTLQYFTGGDNSSKACCIPYIPISTLLVLIALLYNINKQLP